MSKKHPESAPKKRRRRNYRALLPLLLVISLALSLISIPMSGFLDSHLSGLKTASSFKDDVAAAQSLAMQTMEEGAVLLENHEAALPISSEDGAKVALFGLASVKSVYADGRTDQRMSIAESLSGAGFQVNEDLLKFYRSQKKAQSEPKATEYNTDVLSKARNGADIAIVALSHEAGEAAVLSDEDAALLRLVGNLRFAKVIVLMNCPDMMQMDFLNNEEYGIDAAMWIGAPGEGGMEAMGKLLSGELTPSGKTAVTCPYDLTQAPAAQSDDSWQEGIYAGYRYYETRYAQDEAAYSAAVQYPFGYGLSYTEFEESITDFASNGTEVMMSVQVTNTGSASGADVVEVYAQLPWKEGGLEKSAQVLVGFGRTDVLEPGGEQTVEVTFPVSNLASYDTKNGCFAISKGTHLIQLRSDAHTLIDQRALKMSARFKYDPSIANLSGHAAENLLSRSGWENTLAEEISEGAEAVVPEADVAEEGSVGKVKKLSQLTGLEYDDPAWDALLSRMKDKQLAKVVCWQDDTISAVKSIKMDEVRLLDGSAGLVGKAHGVEYEGTLLPCQLLTGAAWDAALAENLGEAEGKQAADMGLAGIYSPSGSIVRKAGDMGYSEDGILAGTMLSGWMKGAASTGTMCFLSDVGTGAAKAGVQAMRELHLRSASMSAGCAAGVIPAEGWTDRAVTVDLARNEWGVKGPVLVKEEGADLSSGASAVTGTVDADTAAMKEAAHHTLYAVANANAVNGTKYGPASHWRVVLVVVDLVLLALTGLALRRPRKKAKHRKK